MMRVAVKWCRGLTTRFSAFAQFLPDFVHFRVGSAYFLHERAYPYLCGCGENRDCCGE
jgi:hypothetical protein